ncbi:Tc toxin subunit A [Bacillus cereus]|uniref:Tc toxin subunit A n=1 Tax=Bacillus cereus TaxID=1396 RepID=UPI002D77084F|nr:Tc toxin subunit A [Bacillus cereus]
MSTTDNAGVFRIGTDTLTVALNQSGYQTVFDIASESISEFSKNNQELSSSDVKEVHRLAVQRSENLVQLFKAWQLHNDPIVRNIQKLSSHIGVKGMQAALKRSLGGGSDFEDLFPERSLEGYAEAASIQSLFSPGRYVTVLYKIARQLHPVDNKLHIDNRRPDLQSLLLTTDNMNKEISSLDMLLHVLQSGDADKLTDLKDTYYPMTLPYDDDLTKINAACEVRSSNLLGIWDVLLDTQRNAIVRDSNTVRQVDKSTSQKQDNYDEPLFLTGEEFYLESNGERLFFANKMETGSSLSVHITIGRPSALDVAPAKFQLVYYKGVGETGQYFLRVADNVSVGGKLLTNCYLTSDNGEHTNTNGPYCLMLNKGNNTIPLATHLPVQIERVTDTSIRIFIPQRGYVGKGKTIGNSWENPLALNIDWAEALTFTLRKNETGNETIPPNDLMPPVADITPSPQTRESLSLTPNSFQLLVRPNPTVEDIANHYNIKTSTSRAAEVVNTLNIVDDFCLKTGLSFNQLLELTMQKDYQNRDNEYKSRFVKFGNNTNVPVSAYGAVFLTGKEETPLWVKQYDKTGNPIDIPVLNFTEDNVVTLAGGAEKLVRLAKNTGLSFEQLDWLITNASQAVLEHGGEIILDRQVLEVIAEFTRLNKKYGITSDMFVAYIGEVNTYAETGKESFYKAIFSTADGATTLPLETSLQFEVEKQGLYETICCGAMGVTADEFFRIGKYCFGNNVKSIKINEVSIAQLYRLGKLPQMFGLRFSELELLWRVMDGGKDTILRTAGANSRSLRMLDIIRRTEAFLDWMDTHQLDIVSLQAMVTDQYNGTATPELYNFLEKVYQSMGNIAISSKWNEPNSSFVEKLCRVLAAGFNLKVNVMTQVMNWMEKTNPVFTLQNFWNEIQAYFRTEHEDKLNDIEKQGDLLSWCQQMSQYVLLVQWCGLSEQDLVLLIQHPEQVLDGQHTVPVPSLHLLFVLPRLKEWQQRVQVSGDEAMRYFDQVNSQTITSETAIQILAHIHGWNEEYTASMSDYLLGVNQHPKNFEQLYTLESWINLGNQLKVGSRTLGELVDMATEDKIAENIELIASVARSLMASVQV